MCTVSASEATARAERALGIGIAMRSVIAPVAHLECNDVEGYAGLEQMHRGGVVLLLKLSHQWR